MKKLLIILVLMFVSCPVFGQTAQTVLPGYLQSTGCAGSSQAPCYKPAATPVKSSATEGSHILKTGKSILLGLSVTASAVGYVLIYDATSAPSDGSVTPVACYYNASGPGTLGIAFTPFPLQFTNGIVVVYSSTGCFTQTTSSTMFVLAEVL